MPVVFLDTAAILDVLRVPFRHELQADVIDSATAMIEEASADQRRIWLVATGNVVQELNERRQFVEDDLRAHLHSLASSVARIFAVTRAAFPERIVSASDVFDFKIDQRISAITDRLVNSIVLFQGTSTCGEKARDRVWGGHPPASRAKQEFKDCEIFEEFLELISLIRQEGCGTMAVFVSPNRKDYGPPPEGHPRIGSDLEACQAHYCGHISWARSIIRTESGG